MELAQLGDRVTAAAELIRPHIRRTPLERSALLSAQTGVDVWLKCEHFQLTGSFKVRGATHRILRIPPEQRERGVVTASSGNHGLGVAQAAQSLGVNCRVFLPTTAASGKVQRIASLGAEVRILGDDCVDAEAAARADAAASLATYVSPYNDYDVIAGQGTIGIEITEQIDEAAAVYASLGGGGLLSGLIAALANRWHRTAVVAASAAQSCVMHQSLAAGRMLDLPSSPTFSDGTAGGVEADTVTFPILRAGLAHSVIVDEADIARAMGRALDGQHGAVEGAAGTALAGFWQEHNRWKGRQVVIVLCGGNVGRETLQRALAFPP